jgi:hypothetical protein
MRRKIIAGAAAAAFVAGGTIVLSETPAEAHANCKLLHIQITLPSGADLIHFCVI